jgi:hypothetical protein
MGAWGTGSFDNDSAGDWAGEFVEGDELEPVEDALAAALTSDDADTACVALAAAEVVARLKGNWGVQDTYTEQVDGWVRVHPGAPSDELVGRAVAAIDRIVEQSELAELWADDDDWRDVVADLRRRVAG